MYAEHTSTASSESGKTPIPSISIEDFERLLQQGAVADEGVDCTDHFTYFHVLLPDIYWLNGTYTRYYKVFTNDLDEWYITLSKQQVKKYFLKHEDFNGRLIIDDNLIGEPYFCFSDSDTEINNSMIL